MLRFLLSKKVFILVSLVILGLGGTAGWTYYKYSQAQKQINKLLTSEGREEASKKEVGELLATVGKLMLLPEGEQPTIATVTDVEALKNNQPFFEKAQNGDKVIVYVGARKAIIYSPSKDVIVNVGVVAVDGQQFASALKVELRNGTTTAGLAKEISEKLKSDNLNIMKVSDSSKKDYEKTIVVSLKVDNKQAAQALAQSLNAEVVEKMPEGEVDTDADVLVVLGKDQIIETTDDGK